MNFIEEGVVKARDRGQDIILRYPPEPNGYLHIGHAKAFSITNSMRNQYHGRANLRFDDTNPAKESMHYVENIKRDLDWLGIKYDRVVFASDYYEQLYTCAVHLIKQGLAYVDDSTMDEIKALRGELGVPGKPSPYRDRSVAENLDLFARMRAGEFPDGSRVLRAKIDMASPNMNLRDPVLYRINRQTHYRTGNQWCIYPMYDFAHSLSDYLEHISNSLCSLEFEDHRPLYNWCIANCQGALPNLPKFPPEQYEFSRLNIEQFVMSKRWLKKFVDEGLVDGWDDPRMPTVAGMRRRGYPATAIMDFVQSTGITKNVMTVPLSALEFYVRAELDKVATRVSVVENPLKVKIVNYPADKTETFTVDNNPHDPAAGTHTMTFSNEIYLDGNDFSDNPPPKYKRLTMGGVVQLRGAYKIKCLRKVGDTLECEITDDKAKGVVQYVDVRTGVKAEIRSFAPLLKVGTALTEDNINRDSLYRSTAYVEKWLAEQNNPSTKYQFMRKGYYVLDAKDSLVFNKTISLREGF